MTITQRTYAGETYTVRDEHKTDKTGGSRGIYQWNGQQFVREANVLKAIDAYKGIDRRGIPRQD